jgi:glucose-6-phosphate isomerase
VEAGKKAAASILELQKQVAQALKQETSPISITALAEKIGAPDRAEIIYKIVRHLAANQRGVQLSGDLAEPASLTIMAL